MDRVNEIIGHLTDEEYDAVLYGVMLRFIHKNSEGLPLDDLYIQADTEQKSIDLYYVDSDEKQPRFIKETKLNEA